MAGAEDRLRYAAVACNQHYQLGTSLEVSSRWQYQLLELYESSISLRTSIGQQLHKTNQDECC
jgi:hypothetical protein